MSFTCPHNGSDMPCTQCDNEMLVADNMRLRASLGLIARRNCNCRDYHASPCASCVARRGLGMELPKTTIEPLSPMPKDTQ